MRARTLVLPWAFLMAVDEKRFETRGQRSSFTGRWAVHAASGWIIRRAAGGDIDGREVCSTPPFETVLAAHGVRDWKDLDSLRGCILAGVEQVACVGTEIAVSLARSGGLVVQGVCGARWELAFGDYSPGRYAFATTNLERLASPVKCKGSLGLWRVPPELGL